MSEERLSYRDAGVDIDAANRTKAGIASLVASTRTPAVLSELGSFAGLCRVPSGLRAPVLVASTDGVGTKLKIAFLTGRHDTVGHDLVNHCVNDVLVAGAQPLFFLDYVGMGRLEPGTVEALVMGVAEGCRENGCALLGGETAEMPDFYAAGEYDLAGTLVGVVEEERILGSARVRVGDRLVALASLGLHTNGYSLARKVLLERMGLTVEDRFPGADESVGEVLLRSHRSYLAALRPALGRDGLHALAHVTGGGLLENLPRVLPPGARARVERGSWEVPAVFRTLQEHGAIADEEMFRAFNMGVGMVAVVAPEAVDEVVRDAGRAGVDAWLVGEVRPGDPGVELA